MKHDQSLQNSVEDPSVQQKKDILKQTRPDDSGSQWQFKILVAIIGLGVLMLILKSLGLF